MLLEDIFRDPDLRLCRYLLAKRPMQEFVQQYVGSLSLLPPARRGNIYIFQEGPDQYESEYDDYAAFDCNCEYTRKTGIGCRHMIRICRDLKISYMETVHPRWKFEKQPTAVKKRRRFSRSTRRRRR